MREEKNVRPDFSKISEDSVLCEPENKKTTREKLSEMNAKEKAAFIAEYYGLKIVIFSAIIGFVLFMVLHMIFAKDIAFNLLAVNNELGSSPAEKTQFYESFLKENGVDPSKVKISVSSGLGVSKDVEDPANQTNLQMIQSRFMTNSVDVFLSNEDVLASIGEFEYLADLNDYLPADIMEKYKDDLVYIKGVDSGKRYPVGIRIPADNWWVEKSGWYPDGVVVGIEDHAKHGKLATAFIMDLLKEKK